MYTIYTEYRNCVCVQVYQNVKELEERLAGMTVENEEEVASYSRLWDQLTGLGQQFHSFLTRPQYIVPFLQPGRLVKVSRDVRQQNFLLAQQICHPGQYRYCNPEGFIQDPATTF